MNNPQVSSILAKRILKEAVEIFGRDSQHLKTMEEAAEVIQATAKLSFAKNDEELEKGIDHLMEELADMQIMIDQMRIMYPTGAIQDWYNIKLLKLKEILNAKKDNFIPDSINCDECGHIGYDHFPYCSKYIHPKIL